MSWQDLVISLSIVLAGYALIPQVIYGFKTKKGLVDLQTSLIYALAIYAVTIVFINLELYFSAIVDFITGSLWLTLFFQRLSYGKLKK